MDTVEFTQQELQVVSLTESAVKRVKKLLEERNAPHHALRVFVSGGGCSGLQYGMALEGEPRETDRKIHTDGLDVVIDPVSIEYLAGATIDYVEDLMGGGFKIDNPNAVAACGCGHSFRTKDTSSADGCSCGS
jgi:iron-sulfur cluster assembly protein